MPNLTTAEYWLTRAEEARAAAEKLNDLCEKEKMQGIAESYERRARCPWGYFPTPARIH